MTKVIITSLRNDFLNSFFILQWWSRYQKNCTDIELLFVMISCTRVFFLPLFPNWVETVSKNRLYMPPTPS